MLLVYKLYPEGPESLDHIEQALNKIKSGEWKQTKREPIAYGMELIKVAFVVPDKVEGVVEQLETDLKNIPGVNQIENAGMTLL